MQKPKHISIHLLAGTNIGGSELLALNIARADSGHFIFVAGKKGALYDEFRTGGAPFFIIPRRFPVDPLYIFNLYRLTRRYHTTILHAHQLPEALNAAILSIFSKQSVFITYHGFRYFEKYSSFKNMFFLLLSRIKGSLFVSNYLKEQYVTQFPGKIKRPTLLYNGIPITDNNEYDKASLKREFNIPSNAILLGMTANFSEVRNHQLILNAFRLLPKNINDNHIHLMFLGQKDQGGSPLYNNALNFVRDNKLNDRVHFAGSRKDAFLLATNFDIFVYASHRETFCLSVIEAIQAAIPVIVNDFPVLSEVTLNGKLANLYKSDDETELAGLIETVLTNLAQYKARAIENAETARKLYNIDTHIQKLIAIYHQ